MTIEPKKELGQNFLIDNNVIDLLVSSADLQPSDTVIEVGPGLGAVTAQILKKLKNNGKLYAIETDPRMVEYLKEAFGDDHRLELVFQNVLNWLPSFDNKSTKIVASLPFYITSPIIHEIIHMKNIPDTVVLLIQKEVAKKISVSAPDASYLSVFVQTFFSVEYVTTVNKTSFNPIPQVDGAIILLHLKNDIPEFLKNAEQKKKYSRFLHRGFASPRKMINKQFNKEELKKAQINPSLRPQDIETTDWLNMFKVLVPQESQ